MRYVASCWSIHRSPRPCETPVIPAKDALQRTERPSRAVGNETALTTSPNTLESYMRISCGGKKAERKSSTPEPVHLASNKTMANPSISTAAPEVTSVSAASTTLKSLHRTVCDACRRKCHRPHRSGRIRKLSTQIIGGQGHQAQQNNIRRRDKVFIREPDCRRHTPPDEQHRMAKSAQIVAFFRQLRPTEIYEQRGRAGRHLDRYGPSSHRCHCDASQ